MVRCANPEDAGRQRAAVGHTPHGLRKRGQKSICRQRRHVARRTGGAGSPDSREGTMDSFGMSRLMGGGERGAESRGWEGHWWAGRQAAAAASSLRCPGAGALRTRGAVISWVSFLGKGEV